MEFAYIEEWKVNGMARKPAAKKKGMKEMRNLKEKENLKVKRILEEKQSVAEKQDHAEKKSPKGNRRTISMSKKTLDQAETNVKKHTSKKEIAVTAAYKIQPKEEQADKHTYDEHPPENEGSVKRKVLIAASEGMPFVATGGLGEVVGALPKSIMNSENNAFDIRVILPLYECVSHEDRQQMEFLGHFNVTLAWRQQYCGVFKTVKNGVVYYFIDNEYYFKRYNPYGYEDDLERFAFFSKAVLDAIALLDFDPEIIHCHDWQTALIPVYMRHMYHHVFARTIFTIHNIEYQGKAGFDINKDVFGLPPEALSTLDYRGCVNLMKAAIECAHQINTVSPTYAAELRDDYYAKGLAEVIRRNEFKMQGILNGIDTESYNPETDRSLFVNYNSETVEKKKQNKIELQKIANLPVDENVPVIAIISRLVAHKGIDLVASVMERLLNERVQVVVLGIGDKKYEEYFQWLQHHYQGKVSSMICFNNDLARKVYAGADFFLMPSKSEPCGLAQMIASRYGTVPIVRATGGLRDTIKDCTAGEGNGFVFEHYTANDLLDAIHRGLHIYHNHHDWQGLMKWIMNLDFSWEKSAKEYEILYNSMCAVPAY